MTSALAPTPYRVRSISARDLDGLTAFYAGLSAQSRAARFHGAAPRIAASTAATFCGPDHQHREGIVAEVCDEGEGPAIIGHVCIEPREDGVAEVAIAVADRWQRRGLGLEMLSRAIGWAQTHGITTLVASIQVTNAPMFALLRAAGHPATFGVPVEDTVDVSLDVRHSRLIAA